MIIQGKDYELVEVIEKEPQNMYLCRAKEGYLECFLESDISGDYSSRRKYNKNSKISKGPKNEWTKEEIGRLTELIKKQDDCTSRSVAKEFCKTSDRVITAVENRVYKIRREMMKNGLL